MHQMCKHRLQSHAFTKYEIKICYFHFDCWITLFYYLTYYYFCYQLTDFGLSKIGLINNTIDLSGHESDVSPRTTSHHFQKNQEEERIRHSAVGTPDYLAPEILLGTEHGLNTTLDLGISDNRGNYVYLLGVSCRLCCGLVVCWNHLV